VHNITTAVRRLSFAPAPRDMKVTDVKKGLFVFTPRPDRPASYKELHDAIVKGGYDIEATAIVVHGTLREAGRLESSGTGQIFALSGPNLGKLGEAAPPGTVLTLTGSWRSSPEGESIEVQSWEVGK
jgi:hypothetical protein